MNQMFAFGEYLFKWFIGSNNGAEWSRMGKMRAAREGLRQIEADCCRLLQIEEDC